MRPDSMIVEPAYIASSGLQVASEGVEKAFGALTATEPALASFIYQSLAAIAGKLALSGAPTDTVQGSHEEILSTVLVSISALRRGHYELWNGSLDGTPLAKLTEQRPAAKKGRRKKGPGAQPSAGPA